MKKVARLTLSILSINPDPAVFRPRLAIGARAYARAIKVIGFALKARAKFGVPYSRSIGIAFFLALITAAASLPACSSPCRFAMLNVPTADLECTDSGFRISECSATDCPADTSISCTRTVAWKATCKKDGREFDCVAYRGETGRCSPR